MSVQPNQTEPADRMKDVSRFLPSQRGELTEQPQPGLQVPPTISENDMSKTLTDDDLGIIKTASEQPAAVKKINSYRPLVVKESSTVICIRERSSPIPDESKFGPKDFPVNMGRIEDRFTQALLFDQEGNLVINGAWEVLLAQSECKNNLKSTKTKQVPMRFAGEYKLAGGMIDEGETPEQAARRELHEEFMIDLPEDPEQVKFRFLEVKQMPPMNSRSDIIYCYVAIASENPWLEALNIDAQNEMLARKREVFAEKVASEEYWEMSFEEKEEHSPEIYQLRWLDTAEAVKHQYTSLCQELVFVNEWQQQQYETLGITARDPMLFTLFAALQIDTFPNMATLLEYVQGKEKKEREELRKGQWLLPSSTPQQVAIQLKAKLMNSKEWNLMFKTCKDRQELIAERLAKSV